MGPAQEANDRTLRLRQLGHHHLGLPLTDSNFVPLDRREHLDQSVRRRTRARPASGYNGNAPSPGPGHRLAQFPLQQRLHQQGEEVHRQANPESATTFFKNTGATAKSVLNWENRFSSNG